MTVKIEQIREECCNYYWYRRKVDEIDTEIENLRYTMNGVHAVSYSTVPMHHNENDRKLAEWLEKQDNLIHLKHEYRRKITMIENWMNQVETSVRFYVWMYCVEGMGVPQMAEQSGMHESNVLRMLNKAVQGICV